MFLPVSLPSNSYPSQVVTSPRFISRLMTMQNINVGKTVRQMAPRQQKRPTRRGSIMAWSEEEQRYTTVKQSRIYVHIGDETTCPQDQLFMRPANERRRFIVTSSLIGRAHKQNNHYMMGDIFIWSFELNIFFWNFFITNSLNCDPGCLIHHTSSLVRIVAWLRLKLHCK